MEFIETSTCIITVCTIYLSTICNGETEWILICIFYNTMIIWYYHYHKLSIWKTKVGDHQFTMQCTSVNTVIGCSSSTARTDYLFLIVRFATQVKHCRGNLYIIIISIHMDLMPLSVDNNTMNELKIPWNRKSNTRIENHSWNSSNNPFEWHVLVDACMIYAMHRSCQAISNYQLI